jgi:flagellar motor protein MotB
VQRNKKHPSARAEEDNPYWMSFSDILSGLLILFVLASMALILQLKETQDMATQQIDQLKKAEEIRRNLLEEVQAELRKQNIDVLVADNETVLRIPESTLNFRTNQYEIPDNYRSNVTTIGRELTKALKKDERFIFFDTIFVEGHTDPRPSRSFVGGNWGLSTNRAISVWRAWEDDRLALTSMTNHQQDQLFSVSGYADSRQIPRVEGVAYGDWLTLNRRIDIRFTIKRPLIRDFEKLENLVHYLEDGNTNDEA